MGYREAVVWATAAASVTRSTTLVPTAISPYLWPPLPVAMAISTLGELAQGRVILNVSVGNILNLGESGIEPVKPIRIMREYVEALRALWAGQPVTKEGELHTLRGAKMAFDQGRQYPIYIASTGPQMLKLAGEIADGVLLSAGLTLASTRRCLELRGGRRAGGGGTPQPRCARHRSSTAMCRKTAPPQRRQCCASSPSCSAAGDTRTTSGLPTWRSIIRRSWRRIARHDFDAAVRLLPQEAASIFAVAGTPSQCRDRLDDYLAIGLDEPVIEISGNVEERKLALEVVREVARR